MKLFSSNIPPGTSKLYMFLHIIGTSLHIYVHVHVCVDKPPLWAGLPNMGNMIGLKYIIFMTIELLFKSTILLGRLDRDFICRADLKVSASLLESNVRLVD